MHVFPSKSEGEILLMEWERFYYWLRRAQEIFYKTTIPEIEEESGKIDEDSFKVKRERLEKKILKIRQRTQGTINGG
jgi:hypothetical protein